MDVNNRQSICLNPRIGIVIWQSKCGAFSDIHFEKYVLKKNFKGVMYFVKDIEIYKTIIFAAQGLPYRLWNIPFS